MSCDDAYSCTIPRAIVKVVCKYSKRLLVVVTAHRSSFGKLVCLFIAPVSCVSFYPIKFYCVFVCKFSECFMAVSDGFVVVFFFGESL